MNIIKTCDFAPHHLKDTVHAILFQNLCAQKKNSNTILNLKALRVPHTHYYSFLVVLHTQDHHGSKSC